MLYALFFFLDAVGFYKKFGFLEVIPPRMLAEGKVAGVSPFPSRHRTSSSLATVTSDMRLESGVVRADPTVLALLQFSKPNQMLLELFPTSDTQSRN
jgi:hypothetical protein